MVATAQDALEAAASVARAAGVTPVILGSVNHYEHRFPICPLTYPDSLARAASLGIDARARLADNDGYGFFEALGDLVVTGPTRTNVNDFRAILVSAGQA